MSFFNYTADNVADEVSKAITGFDNTVKSVSNFMSLNLQGTGSNDAWSNLWKAVSDVSIGISAVAVCMAIIYTYIAIVREGLTLKGDFKRIISIILRLCIAKGLIDTATSFMFWIYSFGAKITNIVSNKMVGGGSSSLKEMYNGAQFAKGLGVKPDSSGFDCFIALQYAKIFSFFLWGLGIFLIIISISRILKLYLMMMFSSIAFAKLPLEGYNGIKEYVSSFFALSLQGAIIVGTVGIYKLCVANSDMISHIYTDSMFGSFGLIVIFSITLVLIISRSELIAKKIA